MPVCCSRLPSTPFPLWARTPGWPSLPAARKKKLTRLRLLNPLLPLLLRLLRPPPLRLPLLLLPPPLKLPLPLLRLPLLRLLLPLRK